MIGRILLIAGLSVGALAMDTPTPARAGDLDFDDNPVIDTRVRKKVSREYDPWNDRTVINRSAARVRVRESALDPNRSRDNADPGSLRYVNKPVYDDSGSLVGYERGWTWTNDGVPHGKLTRVRSKTNATGGTDRTKDTIHYYKVGGR